MKYLNTKEGSLEESISKTMSGKPDSSSQPVESKEKDNLVESTAKELEEAGGKYLKYSDLLLQKGRMMAKNQNTAMIDRELDKEKKKLGIKESVDTKLEEMALVMTEAEGDKEKYQKFFKDALKKFGVDNPADLEGAQKKKFFNYVDKNYKGDHEESVDLEEADAKYITDKDQGDRDLQKLIKKHKLTIKTLQKNVNPGYDEVEISGDKRDMEKMMKTTGDDSMYKFNPRTKEFELDESKKLEEKTTKDVDETLEKIREANIQKGKSMRSILADIWNMNEGKNPFEKEEGKKVKKEEEDSDKTATGKKPTKVEIEPEVK